MPNKDKDVEVLQRETSKILGQHRDWLKDNFKTASAGELLERGAGVFDRVLAMAFPTLAAGMSDSIALVALGSYGRQEVCPHSDLDLLILHRELPKRKLEEFGSRLLGLLWDQKISVGHSIRTVEQCLKISAKDYSVLTSLLDARLVAGSAEVFAELIKGLERGMARAGKAYFSEKLDELRVRRLKFGREIWLTEPFIMEGAGGLRDWNLLKWLGHACLNLKTPPELEKIGLLSKGEFQLLREAADRLFKVRIGLHLLTGEKTDQLRIEQQLELPKLMGIKPGGYHNPADALLAYTLAASERIAEILDRLLFELKRKFEGEKKTPVAGRDWLFEEQGQLLIVEDELEPALRKDRAAALKLFRAQAESGLPLAPESRAAVRKNMVALKPALLPGLMKIFSEDLDSSRVIRELKRCGLLEAILPELDASFYMGQRDAYHVFTVGEHSLRCLEKLQKFAREPEFGDDPEIVWPVLKLAGLIHDLGKGRGADHLKSGGEIARQTANRLQLGKDAELLEFLVTEHMLLNHYAQRRDFYEPRASQFLIGKIGDSSRLKMLFLLTCADIQAVSETSWTSWKAELLRELYHLLLAQIEKRETPSSQVTNRISEIRRIADGQAIAPGLIRELEKLPTRYLLGTRPEKLIGQVLAVESLTPGEILIRMDPREKPRLELSVICDDHPGLFSDLAGALSALNYNILSAEINTLKQGVVLDIFLIEDLVAGRSENWPAETQTRADRLRRTLVEAIEKKIAVPELVGKKRGIFKPRFRLKISPEVSADQESSEDYTILEIQAQDQPGLLYKITRTIFEHELDIHFAKISTRAEKVFDVFYLRDPRGRGKAGREKISQLVEALFSTLKAKEPTGD